ncbi:MAG: hypothetical protein QNM00_06550 [Gammaproteobacteria bacterium]|nr:hypothetical protein [Gammaproteobacteria bacterium]
MEQTKSILMLGRRDQTETMRVAAGLTIFGHTPSVVFLVPVPDTPENAEMAELLEFSDVESKTTVADQSLSYIGADALAAAILAADEVINI